MNKIGMMLSFIVLSALVACAPNCTNQVTESTTVVNLTGQEIKPELCVVPDQIVSGQTDSKTQTKATIMTISIPSAQNGALATDTYETNAEKGTDNKCKSQEGLAYNSQIFLTSASFSQLKLCRDDSVPTRVTFVGLGAGCPAGSTAQSTAISTCTEDLLIHN